MCTPDPALVAGQKFPLHRAMINIGIKIYIQGMMETAPLLPCRKGGALSRLANRFERVSFGNKPNLSKGSGD